MSGQGAGSRASWERVKEGPSPERMSEVEGYTPSDDTTQDIRADFAGFPHRCNDCQHMEDAARFDRWLAAERARIWDEGWLAGWGRPVLAPIQGNPYRKGGDA